MRLFTSLMLLIVCSLPAVSAQAADWELLGQRKVNVRTDHDVIRVTIAEGTFTKIKLRVLNHGIELLDLKVYFGNGDAQDVKVRRFIKAGGETRVIDLKGRHRVIKKVEFVYRTRGRLPGRATIRLWGRH